VAGIGNLFKSGSIGEQFLLWNVGSQLAQSIMGPFLQAIQNRTWSADPNIPLSAAQAAELVQRNILIHDQGQSEAGQSGIDSTRFDHLVKAAGRTPDISMIMELVRRGQVGTDTAVDGRPSLIDAMIDQGIRPEWVTALTELVTEIPSVAEVMNAWLEGQIDEAEARRRYILAGGDPTWFQTSYNAQGSSPTPDMLGTMANRKIIGWTGTGPAATSYAQGFLEGPWRNKWEPAMRRLAEYLPPPRTVVAMIHAGSLTDAQALDLLEKEGLTPELAAAYLADAHHTKASATKELTQAQLIKLYQDGKIDQARVTGLLEKLGYSAANVALIVDLANVHKADTHITAAINRVHSQYVARRLNAQSAKRDLVALKVPADQVTYLMDLWDIEIGANVKQLTAAQITAAWMHKILTEAEALVELGHLGYSQFDAWVMLSIANKGALANKPPAPITTGVNP
jgi:hypothetical protein